MRGCTLYGRFAYELDELGGEAGDAVALTKGVTTSTGASNKIGSIADAAGASTKTFASSLVLVKDAFVPPSAFEESPFVPGGTYRFELQAPP